MTNSAALDRKILELRAAIGSTRPAHGRPAPKVATKANVVFEAPVTRLVPADCYACGELRLESPHACSDSCAAQTVLGEPCGARRNQHAMKVGQNWTYIIMPCWKESDHV